MSNSSLVNYTKLSPNNSGTRTHSIDRITPHCVVGQASVETLGNIFYPRSRQCSCNYGIGADGRVGMYCEEGNRSWCTSSNANDQRAVTIECASDATAPYAFNDTVYNKLIELCVDICRRNGKTKLLWFGDKAKTLTYEPADGEMILTVHRWFANKSCPGDWMYARMGELAATVTAKLTPKTETKTASASGTMYRVQVGAFSNKANAETYAAKVKKAGFDTVLKEESGTYKVQCGAFSDKANAEAYVKKLKNAGFEAVIRTEEAIIYRVQCGAFSKKENADAYAKKLKAAGFDTVTKLVNGMYKVQCGAFSNKANAEAYAAKIKKAGFEAAVI